MKTQKRRQGIRKAMLILSLLLLPLTLYYFSPYLIVVGAFEGIITGSFLVFASLFLLSLLAGRIFCGWLCPAGALEEVCRLALDKPAKGGKWDWIKYFIWVPWISLIVVAFLKSGGIRAINPWYMTTHGISVAEPGAYIVYYAVILLCVILALAAGRRGFCHYVCWMAPFMVLGSSLKKLLKLPSLHLHIQEENCINCKRCAGKCPMNLAVNEMVQAGSMNNSECILCGECADVCPKNVIQYAVGSSK